jgi:hypothetical protein
MFWRADAPLDHGFVEPVHDSTIDDAAIWANGFVDDERGNGWRAGANRDAA